MSSGTTNRPPKLRSRLAGSQRGIVRSFLGCCSRSQHLLLSAYWWPLWLALLALWLVVIRLLGAQWSAYEEYNYGWAVPFLCLYFIWQRLPKPRAGPLLPAPCSPPSAFHYFRVAPFLWVPLAVALLALLWFPLRILQEASPVWRAPSLGLAFCACAITLLFIFALGGTHWVRALAFPVLFFFVAVPWPSGLENFLVQTFTGWDTSLTVEILGIFGIPTVQHGNVIETAMGAVGVDEACSGIRSFQATLMLSLALGEVYRLKLGRRIGLVFGGLALAFGCNVIRTTVLAWVGARKGPAALEGWHDPAGVSIIVTCFVLIWVIAVLLKTQGAESGEQGGDSRPQTDDHLTNDHKTIDRGQLNAESQGSHGLMVSLSHGLAQRGLRWVAVAVFAWVLVCEAATEVWFRVHEARPGPDNSWFVQVPAGSTRYKEVKQTAFVLNELACDKHVSIRGESATGRAWQLFYFRWLPARSLAHRVLIALSKCHRPDHCLPASGRTLVRQLPLQHVTVHGLDLPFRTYLFDDGGAPLMVFQCFHEDGAPASEIASLRDDTRARLLAAWRGRRGYGQRSLEVAVWGYRDVEAAREALAEELGGLLEQGAGSRERGRDHGP